MKYTVERIFNNLKGWSYHHFDEILRDLIFEMRNKIDHSFIGDRRNLKFVMSSRFYEEFSNECKVSGDGVSPTTYRDIRIMISLDLPGFSFKPMAVESYEFVKLIYEEPEPYCAHDIKAGYDFWYANFVGLDRGHGFQRVPHIDHVIFNGPATIVFWKDGTKTVVKHDGKGRKDKRQAILYAFIRKIYGEGKSYHNILNEIEEAVK